MRFALLLSIFLALTLVELTGGKKYLVETKDDSGVKRMKKRYQTSDENDTEESDGQKAGIDYQYFDWFRLTK